MINKNTYFSRYTDNTNIRDTGKFLLIIYTGINGIEYFLKSFKPKCFSILCKNCNQMFALDRERVKKSKVEGFFTDYKIFVNHHEIKYPYLIYKVCIFLQINIQFLYNHQLKIRNSV